MITKKKMASKYIIDVDVAKLKQRQSFKYLVTIIIQDCRSYIEINLRRIQTKSVYH